MSKLILRYVVNAIVGMCLGGIVDHFVGTGYLCSLIGLIGGIVVSFFFK